MVFGLAILAAFVFGSGVVLQQQAALDLPDAMAARPTMLVRLVRRPLWLFGLSADVIGFGIQAWALHRGSLVVVQPLVTTSLLFTLVLDYTVFHQAITWGEWAALGAVLAGLCVFLIAANPTDPGIGEAGTEGWLLCSLSVSLTVAFAVVVGLRLAGPARAGMFAVAGGIANAYMAVVAKAFADSFQHGLLGVLATWTPYVLIFAGIIALLLVSTAYQAGHATIALPILTVADPVVGCIIGILLFGERLDMGGTRGPLVVAAAVLMSTGLVLLGRDRHLADRVAA
jgi:drug/metabolite transporter (DMT)-like permease